MGQNPRNKGVVGGILPGSAIEMVLILRKEPLPGMTVEYFPKQVTKAFPASRFSLLVP
jgi:hypothetical protein